jgi:hypothetical protein
MRACFADLDISCEAHRTLQVSGLITAVTIALRTRVAPALLLLFAQSITRIVKLTVDDVLTRGQDDGQDGQDVYLRLGHPPARVPQPLPALLLELIVTRANIDAVSPTRWPSSCRCHRDVGCCRRGGRQAQQLLQL